MTKYNHKSDEADQYKPMVERIQEEKEVWKKEKRKTQEQQLNSVQKEKENLKLEVKRLEGIRAACQLELNSKNKELL